MVFCSVIDVRFGPNEKEMDDLKTENTGTNLSIYLQAETVEDPRWFPEELL